MNWLREIRSSKRLSCAAVGRAAGITRQHYNLIEAGKRRPSVEVAKAIAVVLGFDWTRFYTDERPLERDTGQDSA